MKTCYFEQRKKSAKLFHKNNQQCTHYKNGILIRHIYSDLNKNTLSWWDDVGIIVNDYRVSIAWTHPRQAFWDHVHNLAIDIVLETDHEQELDSIRLCEMQTPIYKKVGRSRKKIKLYEHNFLPDNRYIDALKQTEREIAASTDFVVVPSLDISWTNHSRFVSACLPLEICNEHDLMTLASNIKRLIRHEVTLNELFPNYHYTNQNWADEKAERGEKEFHVHTIR